MQHYILHLRNRISNKSVRLAQKFNIKIYLIFECYPSYSLPLSAIVSIWTPGGLEYGSLCRRHCTHRTTWEEWLRKPKYKVCCIQSMSIASLSWLSFYLDKNKTNRCYIFSPTRLTIFMICLKLFSIFEQIVFETQVTL